MLHEFDAPPGVGVQQLGNNRFRVAVWGRCARCGRYVSIVGDPAPPMILPAGFNLVGFMDGAASQLARVMAAQPCPGVAVKGVA